MTTFLFSILIAFSSLSGCVAPEDSGNQTASASNNDEKLMDLEEKILDLETKNSELERKLELIMTDIYPANWSYMTVVRDLDLRFADMDNSNLSHADMANADLRYVSMRGADFSYSDTNFWGEFSDFTNSNFDFATLGGDFWRANFTNVSFRYSILGSSKSSSSVDFSEADLTDADMSYSQGVGTFSKAIMQRVNLTGAHLRGNFEGVDLSSADLSFANILVGSCPDNLPPGWICFQHHIRTYNQLIGPDANLTQGDFRDAILTNLDLSGSIMYGINLVNADLSGTNLQGALNLSASSLDGVIWNNTICPD